MFLRFTIAERDSASQQEAGVFVAAYRLRRCEALPEHDYDRLCDLLFWFGENLKVPRRFNRPGFARGKAVSWFKPEAQLHIAMAWEVVEILERHDVRIRKTKADRPGYIVYEDEAQVAAIPFRDTALRL